MGETKTLKIERHRFEDRLFDILVEHMPGNFTTQEREAEARNALHKCIVEDFFPNEERVFSCLWTVADNRHQLEGIEYFSNKKGYEQKDRNVINSLKLGETYIALAGVHFITRIK